MNPAPHPAVEERWRAHARLLRQRGLTAAGAWQPAPEILDSWARCASRGLDLHGAPPQIVVEGADLTRRREQAAHLRRLALAELETLQQQIAGSNHLLAFADRDGVILDLYADERFRASGGAGAIVVGSCWSEAQCGTNGLGTALATGASCGVNGPEHFFLGLGDISCTATPVHDAFGEVVGVLDASSYFDTRQLHTRALLQMAASHIENELLVHQMRDAVVIALHPRTEFLGTLSAGLLAFSAQGRLRAANAAARRILSGLDLRAEVRFEELFAEPFEHLLGRLRRPEGTRLRDSLGSVLAVRALHGAAPGPRPIALPTLPPQPRSQAPSEAPARPVARPTGERSDVAPAAPPEPRPTDWVASDARVQQAALLARSALRMGAHVLILGETGSGKEVLARDAHRHSGRTGDFVAVNCAALPAELIEAELFGYAAGAYTGARREGHAGLITSADGGTLLLDEIADLPAAQQASLLRFLDDQTVRPVGSVAGHRVDVRVLAATHVDLAEAVAARRFRADLYYRLATVQVRLPALRERDDFDRVARHLLAGLDPGARLGPGVLAQLQQQAWPGNFRELRSLLTRALLAAAARGTPGELDGPLIHAQLGDRDPAARLPAGSSPGSAGLPPAAEQKFSGLKHQATQAVLRTWRSHGGSISRTSRELGVSRTTVYRHLRHAGVLDDGDSGPPDGR